MQLLSSAFGHWVLTKAATENGEVNFANRLNPSSIPSLSPLPSFLWTAPSSHLAYFPLCTLYPKFIFSFINIFWTVYWVPDTFLSMLVSMYLNIFNLQNIIGIEEKSDLELRILHTLGFAILEQRDYLRGAEALIAWLELEEGHTLSNDTLFWAYSQQREI